MASAEETMEEDQPVLENDNEMMEDASDSDSSDSSDDSSGDSEKSEDEAESTEKTADVDELEKQISSLQTEIDASPYVYEKHTQLINVLRIRRDSVRLRAARERMSSLFPLTEALWCDWLKDEAESADRTELFERAIADYASVKVWMEYIYHSMRGMTEPNGIENVRKVFEKALGVIGLNVVKGTTVWEAYREFELAVLAGLQPPPGSTQTGDFETQMNRVTKLFKRQLSVPLIGMEDTLREYKSWIEGDVDEETQHCYEKALLILKKLRPFEDLLVQSEPPHLDVYNKYLEFETSSGNLSRIQCLFERAIEENCLIPDLWLHYTEFLEQKVKSADVILPVYRRSVRNCPWVVELWVGFMRMKEMFGRPKEEIRDLFNEAMCAGLTQASEYLALWTAYIDFLRRRIDWNTEHESQLTELRNAFEDAINQMYQSYPVDGDPKCSLTRYWAFVEAKFCHNMVKCRQLWSQIMQYGYDGESQMWIEYVQLERAFGDVKHCRKILQRALNSVQDWPEIICETFLRFEREEGDLTNFQVASFMCKDRMKEVEAKRAEDAKAKKKQIDQKKKGKGNAKPEKPLKQKQAETRSSEQLQPLRPYQKLNTFQKNLSAETSNDSQDATHSSRSVNPVVYVRGSQQKRKLDEVSSPPPIPPEAALILDKEGFKIPPPPGFSTKVEPSPNNQAPGCSVQSSSSGVLTEKSQDMSEEPAMKRMRGDRSEKKSIVFISNLDYSVSEERIKEVFAKVGHIKEVQLAKTSRGQTSKGFGHIEYIDELAATEALKMDRTLIDGRPVFVSKFEPEESRRSKFRYDVGLEKKKLFVRGLPVTVTEEQLKTEFSKHGKVVAVRLVTYRNGKSKGLAYVEYQTEDSASQAVLKMDGQTLEGSEISVAISNPPTRNTPVSERQPTSVPSLGSGKKDNRHAAAKTQLFLVPRALQRNKQSSEKEILDPQATQQPTTENGAANEVQRPKMTNTDFREMLLKK